VDSASAGEYIGWNQLGLENKEDEFSRDCIIKRVDAARTGE
jgi:hypothetical protein